MKVLTNIKAVLIIMILLFLLSCNIFNPDPPPFVITKPICLIEGLPGYFSYAGIEFSFQNTTVKNITSLNLSFMVYGAEKKDNPFIGSNLIKMRFDGTIEGQGQKKFYISLDPYIYSAPVKPYIIDFFCINEIFYEDGSHWEDALGIYYTSSY